VRGLATAAAWPRARRNIEWEYNIKADLKNKK
jgi:hypothetical protein